MSTPDDVAAVEPLHPVHGGDVQAQAARHDLRQGVDAEAAGAVVLDDLGQAVPVVGAVAVYPCITNGRRGHTSVLAEGGPTLNAQLARADLIDELCLTVSPVLAGGDAGRILSGPPLPTARRLAPVSVCEEDGFLFLRLRPSSERAAAPAQSRPASPAGRTA